MKQIAQEQKYILLIAPVRRGRPQQRAAEGKAFPLIIVLIYLYLEKIAGGAAGAAVQGIGGIGGALLKTGVNVATSATSTVASNAIQYAGDWDGFAASMSSFDTWSGVITSGAGSLVTNSLNLATIGDNGVKVTGFSSMNISDMQSLNSVVGGLVSSGLEYGLTGKTTLNVLNIANFGINSILNNAIENPNAPPVNASCGLLELHLDESRGASFALGTSGTDLSIGTLISAARGFDALKTNFEINHYTNKNELQNAAIALREQYGFGAKAEKNQLKSILTGKTELKVGSGPGNAQTILENGKRTVYLNGYSNDMTREEQLKLGITLGHEAYRDGVKGDELTQKIETRNAVAGHTDMMTRMLGDNMYAGTLSGIIEGDRNLQLDLIARKFGDDVFNDYVDNCYDSSADYWRFTNDGNIVWDGSKNLYDENGKLLHEYTGSGGNTEALAEGLGITVDEAKVMLKNAGYTWDGDRHTFVDKNGVDAKNNSTMTVKTTEEIKDFYAKENGLISVFKRKTTAVKTKISKELHETQMELSELANSLDPTYRKLYKQYDEVKEKPYADEESYKTMQKLDENGVPTKESEGFNCIGFVGYMHGFNPKFDVANFDLYEDFNSIPGVDVNNPLKKAKTGDVLRFTGIFGGKADNHVMIYAGNGYVWECTPGSKENGMGVRYQRFLCQQNYYVRNADSYSFSIYRRKR